MSDRAQVFLSCGQMKGSDEPKIAADIAERIRALGFDCYIAVTDQKLQGLRENIFRQLNRSEYFLFVDFKRELLPAVREEAAFCRGSLFSHQEIAIASYLEMECLAFQEKGVKPRDGMLSCFHVNPDAFADRAGLPALIEAAISKKIQAGEWSTEWKNGLSLHLPANVWADAHAGHGGPLFRFFHVAVQNNHRSKLALNCYAVLESIESSDGKQKAPIAAIEIKWAGSKLPTVFIGPRSTRKFDAFKLAHKQPDRVEFVIPWCDSSEFFPHFQGPGRYHLTYAVSAANFPTVRKTFALDLAAERAATTLKEA